MRVASWRVCALRGARCLTAGPYAIRRAEKATGRPKGLAAFAHRAPRLRSAHAAAYVAMPPTWCAHLRDVRDVDGALQGRLHLRHRMHLPHAVPHCPAPSSLEAAIDHTHSAQRVGGTARPSRLSPTAPMGLVRSHVGGVCACLEGGPVRLRAGAASAICSSDDQCRRIGATSAPGLRAPALTTCSCAQR